MNADTLKSEIQSIEQRIFAAESAERDGYEQLRQARVDLVGAIVSERPCTGVDQDTLDNAAASILSCWTSLLHHRWEIDRPYRCIDAGSGWVFRAQAENATTLRVSLEPAGLDEIEALDGMPRTAMPLPTGTVSTVSETLIHLLDEADLRSTLTFLSEAARSGHPIAPQEIEHLGTVE